MHAAGTVLFFSTVLQIPDMSINPALKLKLDELFLRWLTDPSTQKVLNENLLQLKSNETLQSMLAVSGGVVVGPLCSSVFGYFYGPPAESPAFSFEHSHIGTPVATGSLGSLVSPRPNTPPYFPQPPQHNKLFSPRSPRRQLLVSGAGAVTTPVGQAGIFNRVSVFRPSDCK